MKPKNSRPGEPAPVIPLPSEPAARARFIVRLADRIDRAFNKASFPPCKTCAHGYEGHPGKCGSLLADIDAAAQNGIDRAGHAVARLMRRFGR